MVYAFRTHIAVCVSTHRYIHTIYVGMMCHKHIARVIVLLLTLPPPPRPLPLLLFDPPYRVRIVGSSSIRSLIIVIIITIAV